MQHTKWQTHQSLNMECCTEKHRGKSHVREAKAIPTFQ